MNCLDRFPREVMSFSAPLTFHKFYLLNFSPFPNKPCSLNGFSCLWTVFP